MVRLALVLWPLVGCAGVVPTPDTGGDPCDPEPGVLVVDGGFDHGVECWLASSGNQPGATEAFSSATDHPPATDAPSLQSDNAVDGNDEWATVINSQPFALVGGTTYSLRLWARAAAPRTLFVGVSECRGDGPGCSDMLQFLPNDHPAVGESWNELSWSFVAPEDGDEVYVTVEFGGDSAVVWIDDVVVSEP